MRQQKIYSMTLTQNAITRANALRKDPRTATYVAQRTAQMGEIDTQVTTQSSLLTATKNALTQTGATGTLGADGFYAGANLTLEQKKYNELKMKELEIENAIAVLKGKKAVMLDEENGTTLAGIVDKELEMMGYARETVYSLNPASKKFMEWKLQALDKGQHFDDEAMAAKAIALQSLEIEANLQKGIADTLSNAFQSMFQSLIDGTKSFKDSMKDLAKSVLADLAAMFLKAAALKFMLAMFPGMGGMNFMGQTGAPVPPKTRYGGILAGYGAGGVASGPNSGYQATLHGTEAVVPLGNDRAIPVKMQGAIGNTVNVAVNISGQNSNVSATGGGDAQALGRSIGGLVQQHLQQEMRPGGLLNRQGSGGRGG